MSDTLFPIIVVGARGRMGTAVIRQVMDSEDLVLSGAVDRSGGPGLGKDAGIVAGRPETGIVIGDLIHDARGAVVVDFSLPGNTHETIARCRELRRPLVLGTTAVPEETLDLLEAAANEIPIVHAANYSVGVTLLTQISALAARALGEGWDAEIVELHHRHKRDAPSGTALRVGVAVADATQRDFADVLVRDRSDRDRARGDNEIGVFSLRGGDCVGEHTVMFFGEGERLELTHRARDRAIFAAGALRAARWVQGQGPGLYDMVDVLELNL